MVTSRLKEPLGGVPSYKVKPLRIDDAAVLTTFMTRYLEERGAREKFAPADISSACARLFRIGSESHGKQGAITVLLAKMYAEQLIGSRESGGVADLPRDIPSLMFGYLNEINRRHGKDETDTSVHLAATSLAWAIVQKTMRPGSMTRAAAVEALRPSGAEMLEYIERKLGLVQTAGPRDGIRFSLDPLAEYLAALHVVETYGSIEWTWNAFLAQAEEHANDVRSVAPFLLAVRECALDPARHGIVPAYVPARLGEIAGLDVETNQPRAIKVGILHSLDGPMAISERPLKDAAVLAIAEINARGGVLGRRIEHIVEDGRSDERVFRQRAAKLIDEDNVVSIFGCWTSACRQAVRPVVERRNHLLWYPLQYEGDESSPNVVYTGAAPNQQIIPAVDFCLEQLGKRRFFLIGSDYVFPRKAHRIVKAYLAMRRRGAECVGEEYQPLEHASFSEIARRVKASKADVVFNTVNGQANNDLFRALRDAGVEAASTPVMSVSLAEVELDAIGWDLTQGHYCAWNYFQSLDLKENDTFVNAYRQMFGNGRVTDDPIEAAYFQVHLFAAAVEKAGSTDPREIRKAVRGLEFSAPGGMVRVDEENQHTWKVARIGRIRADRRFEIHLELGRAAPAGSLSEAVFPGRPT